MERPTPVNCHAQALTKHDNRRAVCCASDPLEGPELTARVRTSITVHLPRTLRNRSEKVRNQHGQDVQQAPILVLPS